MSRKAPKPVKGQKLNQIGRVKEIVQSLANPEDVKLLCAWFYRPEEAVGGRKAFHGEKELFSSDHLDWCHKHTVLGKCRVHSLKKYQNLTHVTENDFFSRFTYKPAVKEFEPDRVPVFCKCEMPYNPDKFMVMCDHCDEWYHPECLGMSKAAVEKTPAFTCVECKRLNGGAIKRQNTAGAPPPYPNAAPGMYRTPMGPSCR